MTTIELTEHQAEVFKYMFDPLDPQDSSSWRIRNGVLVASRGFGKSFIAATCAANAVTEMMALPESIPNKQVVLVAATNVMVSSIYLPILNNIFRLHERALDFNRTTNTFKFSNNVTLKLFSFEAIERIRGQGIAVLITDEMTSWSNDQSKIQEAWESVLYPCVTTRWSPARAKDLNSHTPGRTLNISTPRGFDYFYDLYNLEKLDKSWKSWRFDYTHSPYLDPAEIEKVKLTMDPTKFSREYGASFEESGLSVFYCFNRDRNLIAVDKDTKIQPGEQLLIGLDFNVGKMSSCICVERGGQLLLLDEYVGANNTEEWCRRIWEKYGKDHDIAVFPDPSGNARKTSATAGTTDFSIIKNARNEYAWKFSLHARKAAPKIVDSVAAVNKKLLDAAGNVNFLVSNDCRESIRSLERTSWVDNNQDSAMIDKKQDLEHMSDAIRYLIEYRYPAVSEFRGSHRRTDFF